MGRPSFPRTLREFRRQFSSDAACLEYLAQSRWPDGFVCPNCGGKKHWVIKEPFGYECQGCGRRTSPTAGTAMHRSHVGIQEWFWAAYLVATHTPGFSAKQLERQIGCAYRTAWFMLHRLRRAMVNDARSRLEGNIETDETIVGGPVKGKRGRGVTVAATKTLVFGAVEVSSYTDKHGKATERANRIRLAIARKADEESIGQFLMQNVAERSTIRTDGWKGYSKTALADYRHRQSPGARAAHIHRAFGNLKTWLNGTHHGVAPKYLQTYLDEFVFRFNRRKTPMAAFQTLLGIATCKSPQTLTDLKEP
jgi:transposase-like protein